MNWRFWKREKEVSEEGNADEIESLRKELDAAFSKTKDEETPVGAKDKDRLKDAGKIDRVKDRLWPDRSYLINMELRNGMHKYFIVNTKTNHFKFADGLYVIDPELKYFDVTSRTYCLDYHQDIPLPIMRKIPVDEIQKTVKALSSIDPEKLTTAMNPRSLDAFIEGKVIEQLMKAQSIDDFFKRESLKSWIVLAVVVIHLLLFLKASGILESIRLPF